MHGFRFSLALADSSLEKATPVQEHVGVILYAKISIRVAVGERRIRKKTLSHKGGGRNAP